MGLTWGTASIRQGPNQLQHKACLWHHFVPRVPQEGTWGTDYSSAVTAGWPAPATEGAGTEFDGTALARQRDVRLKNEIQPQAQSLYVDPPAACRPQ